MLPPTVESPDFTTCVIIGTSGHAQVIFETVKSTGTMQVNGFFDDFRRTTETVFDLPILGGLDAFFEYCALHKTIEVIIGVGDNYQRSRLFKLLSSLENVHFPTIISPHAVVSSSAKLGPGTVVFAGAVVQTGCHVGRCCILNTAASLDHGSKMSDFSSLAPHACTGGGVSIGSCSSIGINASIKHNTRVGCNTVVGAGATVLEDLPEGCVAVGTPARVIRMRTADEPYL